MLTEESSVARRLLQRLTKAVTERALADTVRRVASVEADVRALRLQVGQLHARSLRTSPPSSLRDAELKVFSQFGEDGIIQYLIHNVGPLPATFVEFGVQDYSEANTLFLLLNDNWRGLIMDGSESAMTTVKGRDLYWRHDLTAVGAFVDRDNVDDLIRSNGFSGEIGLLSIDIDGNDYWVWERLAVVQPVVVVVEYNSVFGSRVPVSVPYDPRFQRTSAHASNLYWGCSLPALCYLAQRKGFAFVGSNSAGNNAFFVRADRAGGLRQLSAAEGYVESRFRESRDADGALTYLAGRARLDAIAHMPLVDVVTGRTITAGELRA